MTHCLSVLFVRLHYRLIHAIDTGSVLLALGPLVVLWSWNIDALKSSTADFRFNLIPTKEVGCSFALSR